jgi:hypothetical protein
MPPRDSKAMTDLCEYYDPLTDEQIRLARRLVAGNADSVEDAVDLMMMLGIHPSQDGQDLPAPMGSIPPIV